MTLPWLAWLGLAVVELNAYAALVVTGHPWWALPVLALFLINRRPKAPKA